jgi:hypothetical protein
MALIHVGGGFFCPVWEQFAVPGLAVEQLAQEICDIALSRAGVKQPPACSRCERDESGSNRFRHVWWVWIKTSLFNACKSHVYILHVNNP